MTKCTTSLNCKSRVIFITYIEYIGVKYNVIHPIE